MELASSIPALGAAGAVAAAAFKSPELLKELYGDLAKPGVLQVGKAIGSILGLGNTVLIPIRMLNEAGRVLEQRTFKEIAERLSSIPEEHIVDVAPEIGVPIIERLSYTRDDTLRAMFVELLAKAATADRVGEAHPSFVNVIGSICSDEALLLQHFAREQNVAMIEIRAKGDDSSFVVMNDYVMLPVQGLVFNEQVPLYLSNLTGLGLIEIERTVSLQKDGVYEEIEAHAKTEYPYPDVVNVAGADRKISYEKQVLKILPHGTALIKACT